ncbi:MAG: hypothetical protein WBD36_09645 [Bacteroidota bacterium]
MKRSDLGITALMFASALAIDATLQCGCDKGIELPRPSRTPRDYVWSADTFYTTYTPQTMLNRVWGSSPKNVFVTGSTSTNALMYRFDGDVWNPVILPDRTPIAAFFEFSQVHGFSANDIYLPPEK